MAIDLETKKREYNRYRRGSVAPSYSEADSLEFQTKEIKVRTPRRGTSKNITVNNASQAKSFPIGRLNNYDKDMKKHRGPLSFTSQLESIEDIENEEQVSSQSN